jgi:hypothetical protein
MDSIRVSIHQPNFLPWLGYFLKIVESEIFIVLDQAVPSRGANSWVNRTLISLNGVDRWLTIPLDNKSRGKLPISDLKSRSSTVSEPLMNMITNYYRNEPFGSEVCTWISQFTDLMNDNFVDANLKMSLDFLEILEYKLPKIFFASSLGALKTTKTKYLIDLVKSVSGDTYISGEGAKDYLDYDLFARNDLKLEIIKFEKDKLDKKFNGLNRSFIDIWARYGLHETRKIIEIQR